ncbi:MAG: hypothetical protein L0346_04340 [Chloroflexi bacterium]|nr:hypothetical protein [Chloroflexota bacterium]
MSSTEKIQVELTAEERALLLRCLESVTLQGQPAALGKALAMIERLREKLTTDGALRQGRSLVRPPNSIDGLGSGGGVAGSWK